MKPLFQSLLAAAALAVLAGPALAGPLADHQGRWMGEMTMPDGAKVKVGADLFNRADGEPWASVAVPDNGVLNIPVARAVETGDSVELDVTAAKLKLTWAGDHFDGVWAQGRSSFPLTLTRIDAFPVKARPQTPVAPLPYAEQTLALKGADGVTLGATLSMPTGVARPILVILVHGSGPGTRDQEMMGHKNFAVIADHLTRNGVAVLRYDKRGVAFSTGDYEGHTKTDLANDLQAVAAAMRARGGFSRIGLVGHSEGPGIAAEVAARQPKAVNFIVSLAGVGFNGLDAMLLQDRQWALENGADAAAADQLMVYVRRWYDIIIAEAEPKARIEKLKALQASLSPEDKALIAKHRMNQGTLSLDWAKKPFVRAGLTGDVTAAWRKVRVPVLALNGDLDHQVPPENLAGIAAALKAGGNRRVETALLTGLNHPLQRAKTGAEDEYAQIEETIAPEVLDRVTVFVKKQR